jgi:cardiolipin synthase
VNGSRWTGGNRVRLLENGEAYFPAVFEAIRGAQREVILETFILQDDKVGRELQRELIAAAQRGVQVDLMIDGFGSDDLPPAFIAALTSAGVRVRTFDPSSRWFGKRVNLLRRMHRKIVVVDRRCAFVGGINYAADQLADFGPLAKQDHAVELNGPIVDEIRAFAVAAFRGGDHAAVAAQPPQPPVGTVEALFVTRDNVDHPNDIERHYRVAIRTARKRVLIANAYFFPGYRLLRELGRAARRGVRVQLILQGEPDMPIVRIGAKLLYEHLQRDGVRIHEYCRRPLHSKVAVIDDDWATIGSSNLDPLSLSLNLEANVVLRDAAFASQLRARLDHLIATECKLVELVPTHRWRGWAQLRSTILFHFLRHFPGWASRLPPHTPRLEAAHAAEVAAVAGGRDEH